MNLSTDPSNNFAINLTTGVASLTRTIDRDILEDPYFEVMITAIEEMQPHFSSTTNCTIFVDDLDDNVPTFSSGEYHVQVYEDFIGPLSFLNESQVLVDVSVADPDQVSLSFLDIIHCKSCPLLCTAPVHSRFTRTRYHPGRQWNLHDCAQRGLERHR